MTDPDSFGIKFSHNNKSSEGPPRSPVSPNHYNYTYDQADDLLKTLDRSTSAGYAVLKEDDGYSTPYMTMPTAQTSPTAPYVNVPHANNVSHANLSTHANLTKMDSNDYMTPIDMGVNKQNVQEISTDCESIAKECK